MTILVMIIAAILGVICAELAFQVGMRAFLWVACKIQGLDFTDCDCGKRGCEHRIKRATP